MESASTQILKVPERGMVLLICGLTQFLREVWVATHLTVIDHTRLK